ncbi:MAG: DUF3471 domain-containing protein [Sphingobacteriia bacterium]|nr:MAG: DUF3471 domain-containing protein [Sphingobacteriia bacterium]
MKKILFFFALAIGLSLGAAAQADTTLNAYLGKYKFPEGSVVSEVVVALEAGGLTMGSSAGTSTLVKVETDVFTITQFQGTATFKRDENKKVVGVTINAMGYLLEGTRSEGLAGWVFRPLLKK